MEPEVTTTTEQQPVTETATETPVERTPVESTGSLADHREQFPSERRSTRAVEAARQAVQAEQAPVVEKKRNRARSQDASPDELKQISALGREAREIEEAVSESLGLKARDGESPRLFELRRRKEIAEAVKTLKAAPAVAKTETPRAATASTSDAKEPDANDSTKYPYGNLDPKYQQDLIDYSVEKKFRAQEVSRQQADAEAEAAAGKKRFAERWAEAEKEIPGFKEIASREVPWQKGDPIDLWIWARPYGPKLLHYLNSPDHLIETREIMALPVDEQLERLSLLGATFKKTPAGVNGNNRSVEPAPVVTPSPRLPTPVKTGPMTRSSEPPDPSKMSLRQFRETYHANTRRRR